MNKSFCKGRLILDKRGGNYGRITDIKDGRYKIKNHYLGSLGWRDKNEIELVHMSDGYRGKEILDDK